MVFAGPLRSGESRETREYVALHKGGVDLSTGLYVREDEDLVLDGVPPLVLRRTYLSRYRVSREFGIGTTHDGELYLIGDTERFGWIALVLPSGTRIRFDRTTPGTTLLGTVFEHRSSPTRFRGARLKWNLINWAMRLTDRSTYTFKPCSGPGSTCSIVETRDAEENVTHYRRDRSGTLLKIECGDRWIAFDYDDHRRITRAYSSTKQEVWYGYDERGRLTRVRNTDGTLRRYTYTDLDEMETIDEPEISIRNTYESGRVVRQVNLFPGDPEPLVWEFAYTVHGETIVAAETARSDGGWKRLTFDRGGYLVAQSARRGVSLGASFTYTRDPVTNAVTSATVECVDRTGRLGRHTSLVRPGELDRIEADLVQTHCRAFPPAPRARR